MKRLLCLLILILFLTPSCKSVDTFLQKKDLNGAATFCESKKGKDRSDCFEKLAIYHLGHKNYNTAAVFYVKLAKETGIKEYYTKAGDAYLSRAKLDLAVKFYMKAENYSKAKKTMRDYLYKNRKKDRYKEHKFISKYCEKLGLTEEYERLAEIAVTQKNFSAAASYRKKVKEKKRTLKLWEKEGFINLKKKKYRKAADYFSKAKKPLFSKDAFISGAEKTLKQKKPRYKYAMKNYQLAGIEELGKKRAVMVMIRNRSFSRAFKLAKTIDSDFYSEALIAAGDANLSLDFDQAVSYYKRAGLKNYQCRIGDFYLKGKLPDFNKAESWYSKSSDTSCKSRLLLKALQINDTTHIKKYSGGSKDKNVLNKIAENAEAEKQYVIAATYYEKAGKKDKADIFWKKSVKKSIEENKFYLDYQNVFKGCNKQVKDFFWQLIRTEITLKQFKQKRSVLKTLIKIKPELALGYLSNYKTISDSDLLNDVDTRPYLIINNLLDVISVEEKFFKDENYKDGFKNLYNAQYYLSDEEYTKYYQEINSAKKVFLNR